MSLITDAKQELALQCATLAHNGELLPSNHPLVRYFLKYTIHELEKQLTALEEHRAKYGDKPQSTGVFR